MNVLATTSTAGWIVGYVIATVVVLVVVALVVPILLLAKKIGDGATAINDSLTDAVHNTAALSELNTTVASAGAITAGLNRGRKKLGG